MEVKNNLGVILLDARKANGHSRAELAKLAGMNANSIAKYEKAGEPGGQYPPFEKLVRLCFVLRLDPRVLFLAACKTDEEFEFYYSLNEHLPKAMEIMEHFGKAFFGVMALAAADEVKSGDVDGPMNKWLGKTYGRIKQEVEESGRKIEDVFKEDGPGILSPSRSISHATNQEAVGAASTKPEKDRDDEAD